MSAVLACGSCGIACPDPDPADVVTLSVLGREGTPQPHPDMPAQGGTVTMALCATCSQRRRRAAALVADPAHARLVARIGSPSIAVHRVGCALDALAALAVLDGSGRTAEPAPDLLPALVTHLAPAGAGLRWSARYAPGWTRGAVAGATTPSPWAHLGSSDVAAAREGYAAVLADQVHALHPREIRPPSGRGGCMFCGVGSVSVEPVGVPAWAVWRQVTGVNPYSIGGRRSPGGVSGYLCPLCSDAVDSVGSVGRTAMERAVLAHVGLTSDGYAPVEIEGLVAWAVAPGRPAPSGTPWDHLDLSPLTADALR